MPHSDSDTRSHVCCSACAKFYRIVLSAVPGGATLCALICLAILTLYVYRRTRQLRGMLHLTSLCSYCPALNTYAISLSTVVLSI